MNNRFVRVFFAADGGAAGGAGGNPPADPQPAGGTAANQNPPAPAFDYDKLASLVAGKQTVTEESVLKGYFKQQGLSQEEMTQAIQAFKAQIQSAATMAAVSLGIDAKTIPYVLKMADLSQAVGQDGKISEEAIKNALNAVLEAVPQLNPAQETQKGFQIGGSGTNTNPQTPPQVQPQVPTKRWNRWN